MKKVNVEGFDWYDFGAFSVSELHERYSILENANGFVPDAVLHLL